MKKNRTLLLLLSLLLILSIFFSACSARSSDGEAPQAPDYGEDYPGSPVPGEDEEGSPINPIDPVEPPINPADPDLPRKLIQNAQMTLVSTDPVKTKSDIESKAKSLGGLVSDFSQQNNDYIYVQMTVEVPSDKLAVFLRQINDSGVKVESQEVSSEDVTDAYYDTETRLKSTRELLEHYRELLKDARNIDETLQVQARIDQLTIELESLQGYLNRLKVLTTNSRVYIEIYQQKDPLLEKPSELEPLTWEHVKYYITNGFNRMGTVLLLVAQYLFIGITVGLPIILVVIVIILIIYFVTRRKKKKRLRAEGSEVHSAPNEPEQKE
ncbi:MAG: DUF4349 domain-containing protein [Eubacteriales bacterium]|nr:DUF4349 domain-containing protein [Eubacteriales bacterium]